MEKTSYADSSLVGRGRLLAQERAPLQMEISSKREICLAFRQMGEEQRTLFIVSPLPAAQDNPQAKAACFRVAYSDLH